MWLDSEGKHFIQTTRHNSACLKSPIHGKLRLEDHKLKASPGQLSKAYLKINLKNRAENVAQW